MHGSSTFTPAELELFQNFDVLPANCIVPDKVAARVLNLSERTLRRRNTVPIVRLSPGRHGRRVGDVRDLAQGLELRQAGAALKIKAPRLSAVGGL
jgi:hypothetical protein